MIKKFILFSLIIFILYILALFKLPQFTSIVWNIAWLNWFNEFVLSFKSTFDKTVTNIPSQEEFIEWSLELKENVINWVDVTKDKIDDIRETIKWAESKYNDLKETYDETKEFINTNSWKIKEIKETIQKISNLTNTWEIN